MVSIGLTNPILSFCSRLIGLFACSDDGGEPEATIVERVLRSENVFFRRDVRKRIQWRHNGIQRRQGYYPERGWGKDD